MNLYWDAVLNHKAGADDKEKCKAQEVDQNGINLIFSALPLHGPLAPATKR